MIFKSLRRRLPSLLPAVAALLLALPAGGCNIIGALAQLGPHPVIEPAYKGLKGQTIAIVVWSDNLTFMNYPDLQARLADAIQGTFRTIEGSGEDAAKDLAGVRFIPNETAQEFLRRYPASTYEEVAAAMPATRVMYIEIHNFDIHTQLAEDFFHGQLDASVRVLEVSRTPTTMVSVKPTSKPTTKPTSKASTQGVAQSSGERVMAPGASAPAWVKMGFEVRSIKATYPRRNPVGTTATDFGEDVYSNTLREFAEDLSRRFVTHSDPND